MTMKIADLDVKVLAAAVECAREEGYQWITREMVAKRAGVSKGSVNTAFGTVKDLKRAVLKHAVENGITEIVAQGLADMHPIAKAAPAELKTKAANLLLTA